MVSLSKLNLEPLQLQGRPAVDDRKPWHAKGIRSIFPRLFSPLSQGTSCRTPPDSDSITAPGVIERSGKQVGGATTCQQCPHSPRRAVWYAASSPHNGWKSDLNTNFLTKPQSFDSPQLNTYRNKQVFFSFVLTSHITFLETEEKMMKRPSLF